jgi:hypothetical protein
MILMSKSLAAGLIVGGLVGGEKSRPPYIGAGVRGMALQTANVRDANGLGDSARGVYFYEIFGVGYPHDSTDHYP